MSCALEANQTTKESVNAAYWTTRLEGAPALSLPTVRARQAVRSTAVAQYPFAIPSHAVACLATDPVCEGATVFPRVAGRLLRDPASLHGPKRRARSHPRFARRPRRDSAVVTGRRSLLPRPDASPPGDDRRIASSRAGVGFERCRAGTGILLSRPSLRPGSQCEIRNQPDRQSARHRLDRRTRVQYGPVR